MLTLPSDRPDILRRTPGATGAAPAPAWDAKSPTTAMLHRVLGALRGSARADIAAQLRPVLDAAIDKVSGFPSPHARDAAAAARAALERPARAQELGVLTEAAAALEPFLLDAGYVPTPPTRIDRAAVYAQFTAVDPPRVRDRLNQLYLTCARNDGEVRVDAYDVCEPTLPLGERPQWHQRILPDLESGSLRMLVVWRRGDLLSPTEFPNGAAYEGAWSYMAAWFAAHQVRLVFRNRDEAPTQTDHAPALPEGPCS
ncbi:hypothetical protein [Streptomyces sp. TLI_146]|uniref:hypothetical protein n=1 Tax=Streptomyces sp. TLI_146 TaxID=1938858 RepID=UPI000C701636|nr:hypothetical protein [Streptomyces sp. TLI_146]PKV82682.1 hypothetical protein BX283_0127 [Streptomyces sp. TLI_146]